MGLSAISTIEKQALARRGGGDLARRHGRKRHYSIDQIRAAARRQDLPLYWDCWAYSLYASEQDFSTHHLAIGEACDYGAMRERMLDAISLALPPAPGALHEIGTAAADAPDASWWSDLLNLFDTDFFDP